MKFTIKKSILRPLTASELETGGDKIKKIGKKGLKRVREILSSATMDGRRTLNGVTLQLTSELGGDRDWKRVAITEKTASTAKASLDLIISVLGSDAKVFRIPAKDCCKKCHQALEGKVFRASKVPAHLAGALHPNCVCPPWQAVGKPNLVKAYATDFPMGMVRRVWDGEEKVWKANISTGNGYWVPMDSVTGKAIIQTMLLHVPAVVMRDSMGYTILKHGYLKTDKKYVFVDVRKLGAGRWYPFDLGAETDESMKLTAHLQARTLDDYISKMKQVLPVVATMAEYWDDDRKLIYFCDFIGYKTLTDWVIVFPGKLPEDAIIGTYSPVLERMRGMLRRVCYQQLNESEIKK